MKNRICRVGSLGRITLNGWVALYNVHLNNDQLSPINWTLQTIAGHTSPIHLTTLIIHENFNT